jgi:hypothetical protein
MIFLLASIVIFKPWLLNKAHRSFLISSINVLQIGVICVYLWEKYFIICKPKMATLNKRNELVSACRHNKKFLLIK